MYGRGWQIDDAARLATLRDFGIFGSEPEPQYDLLTAEAAKLCSASFAMVNIIEADQQWFKSQYGGPLDEPAIEDFICTHCLELGGEMVIPDLSDDDRTKDLPIVAGAPHLRFYAGVPLVVRGQGIGVLAVMDADARPGGLSDEQSRRLAKLAERAVELIEGSSAIAQLN